MKRHNSEQLLNEAIEVGSGWGTLECAQYTHAEIAQILQLVSTFQKMRPPGCKTDVHVSETKSTQNNAKDKIQTLISSLTPKILELPRSLSLHPEMFHPLRQNTIPHDKLLLDLYYSFNAVHSLCNGIPIENSILSDTDISLIKCWRLIGATGEQRVDQDEHNLSLKSANQLTDLRHIDDSDNICVYGQIKVDEDLSSLLM